MGRGKQEGERGREGQHEVPFKWPLSTLVSPHRPGNCVFTQAVSLGSSLYHLTGFTVDTYGPYLKIFLCILSQFHTCVLGILIHIYEFMYSPHCLFLPTLCLPRKPFSATQISFFSVAKCQSLTLGDLYIILKCWLCVIKYDFCVIRYN